VATIARAIGEASMSSAGGLPVMRRALDRQTIPVTNSGNKSTVARRRRPVGTGARQQKTRK
jgi:hypothetical protein